MAMLNLIFLYPILDLQGINWEANLNYNFTAAGNSANFIMLNQINYSFGGVGIIKKIYYKKKYS